MMMKTEIKKREPVWGRWETEKGNKIVCVVVIVIGLLLVGMVGVGIRKHLIKPKPPVDWSFIYVQEGRFTSTSTQVVAWGNREFALVVLKDKITNQERVELIEKKP